MLEYEGFEIYWDGHASIRIVDEGFTVAVDPYSKVSPDFDADLVLITHEDVGHYDIEEIAEVCGSDTCLVIPESMKDEDIPCEDIEYIKDGETIDIFNIEVEAVPMHNDEHEKGTGVGYRFVMRGTSFYAAGDTGIIEEAWDLEGRVDVAFLPVDGEYTMDIEEAVKMAVRIKPDFAIPYHYGGPFFSDIFVDTRAFKAELEDRNIGCEIMEE
ncbi:MAG: MBL fold metallo-hydrolase [Candidatus Nanohaloarchaea archaeon]